MTTAACAVRSRSPGLFKFLRFHVLGNSFEAARKIEQQRCDQLLAVERERSSEKERRLLEERRRRDDELAGTRRLLADVEARAKQAEEQLARRRLQPAAVGRTAEKDFAAMMGSLPDFRISAKLPKGGDYEVWIKNDVGDGTLAEVTQPVLVDVKRESAALQNAAITKLVRDCRARDVVVGALVADRLEEVAEIFGTPRLRVHDGVTVLLTSVDAFASDLRLLGPYLRLLVDAKRNGDESLVTALTTNLGEISKLIAEIERSAGAVATVLEKQASVLRDKLVEGACARVREILSASHERLADAG